MRCGSAMGSKHQPAMDETDRDPLMRMAAFEHVRRLGEVHDHLTATELKPGFVFQGERIDSNAGRQPAHSERSSGVHTWLKVRVDSHNYRFVDHSTPIVASTGGSLIEAIDNRS